MKLSILIPTHNRPELFTRCLESALQYVTDDIEIIVNNDSNDITEINDPHVQYFYNKYDHLSQVYEFLLKQATGEFVYFLEDDDYLNCDIAELIDPQISLIAGNYYPMYNTPDKLVLPTIYRNGLLSSKEFLAQLNREHLQLSQHIYRRTIIENFPFPSDSDIHNDILLTEYAAKHAVLVKTVGAILYKQTVDGGDNISFYKETVC